MCKQGTKWLPAPERRIRDNQIMSLRRQGLSFAEIAKEMKMSASGVEYIIDTYNDGSKMKQLQQLASEAGLLK